MSSPRPESHVAQQIRRDKLRIQNLEDFPTNVEHLSLYAGLSSDLLQVRNVRNANMLYEPSFYSPEVVNFSTPSNPSPPADEPKPHYGSFLHPPEPAMSSGTRDHLGYDWMVNYASGSVVNETSNPNSNFAITNHGYNELMIQHPLYQNTLQDIVKSASAQGSDVASLMQHQQSGNTFWVGDHHQQQNQLHFETNNLSGDSINNPQGLSLSLSSNSQSKLLALSFGEACGSTKPVMKPSSLVVASTAGGYRNVGPLGPFTGYATILKSSRYLKPAQELLDEFCGVCGGRDVVKVSDISEGVNASESGLSTRDTVVSNAGGASSSGLHGSEENSGDGGARGGFGYSSGPEYQQKKAKLLYMQEEVTRKYKQYHQQMQMVVSSFESVAGLSSATPYVATALKSVARHFKCLKSVILDQIKHTREVLGEDLSGSSSGTGSKLDIDMARLRYADQSFQKNKTGFLEPQQQAWRPQRGLPERAVAILKAWLFEHFLHPYPTDTDKHMLASQTGLSRNQVSNWFINARVRVWKPMVEEIHNLETKSSTGGNQNEGTSGTEGTRQQAMVDLEPLNKFGSSKHGDGDGDGIPEKQFQCLEMSSSGGGHSEGEGFISAEQWNQQEKRSKLECHQIPSNLDGTLMGFVPYRRGDGGGGGASGLDVAGLGPVSLTLGLRHGVEGVQHQQQHLQQEQQLRRHFGEHMIHDLVG